MEVILGLPNLLLHDVMKASDHLALKGINARVLGIHTVKPIDKDAIINAASQTGGIITIEEHNKDGGLGSAVAEVCMDAEIFPKKFLRIGLDNVYSSLVGSQKYLKSCYKMDYKYIVKSALDIINY